MSKIKSSLPEGFSVLTGDELDGSPDVSEPTDQDLAVGFALQDLSKAVQTLEENKFALSTDEIQEIEQATTRLGNIAKFFRKPF
jgi:hypothetical protein